MLHSILPLSAEPSSFGRSGQIGAERLAPMPEPRLQHAAYRLMAAMAGDRPGFEQASRALFAGDRTSFAAHAASWPVDIRAHVERMARGAT
jgi:hypothetical protein